MIKSQPLARAIDPDRAMSFFRGFGTGNCDKVSVQSGIAIYLDALPITELSLGRIEHTYTFYTGSFVIDAICLDLN